MLHLPLRVLTEVGPAATLFVLCVVCSTAALILYIGIAMWATLVTRDLKQQNVRYQVFRDLLNLLRVVICELVRLFRAREHR